MRYSVWMDGTRIGETEFELRHGRDRRGGIFHPTEMGISLLPGITAMTPALLGLGRLCRAQGIAIPPDAFDDAEADAILATPECNRMIGAAEQLSKLELRNPTGEVVEWESLLISDLRDLATDAEARKAARHAAKHGGEPDPVRYFISATFVAASQTWSVWGRKPHVAS